MAETVQYAYGSLADCVAQMKAANGRIEAKITDLTKQVQNLLSSFSGDSSQAYESAAKIIEKELTTSNQELNTLGTSVQRSADNMKAKDRQTASTFHS